MNWAAGEWYTARTPNLPPDWLLTEFWLVNWEGCQRSLCNWPCNNLLVLRTVCDEDRAAEFNISVSVKESVFFFFFWGGNLSSPIAGTTSSPIEGIFSYLLS